ncbi:MAG: MATE family efflux transporter [Phycisphaerales bacterium]|nr:MATE family efflux transporter [Phycisphaerales bacterium]
MTDKTPRQHDDEFDPSTINLPIHDCDQEDMVGSPSFAQPNIDGSAKPTIVTDDGRFKTGRLKGLTMGAAIFVLAWPVVLESFLNSLVGLVDTKLSASLPNGEAATDAIGGASYIMWLIGLVIMAIGVGATALISRSVGKGRIGAANVVLGQALTLALGSGMVIAVLIYFLAHPITDLLNMTPAAAQYFDDYMKIIAFGVPFASVLFALIACSRGAGDSISPLMAMIARNIVNIVISWGFSGVTVAGLTSPLGLDWGVKGIAFGTVIGDLVGAILIMSMAMSGRWSIKLKLRRMKIHSVMAWRLVRLGVPNFFETFGMWIGNFFIIAFVGLLARQTNTDGMLGAHIIGIRIEAFSFMPGFGMGIAAATLAGQYLGMGRPDLAKKAVFRCTIIASIIMGLMGLAFVLFARQMTAALSGQPAHLEMVPPLLIICGVIQVPFAIGIVFRSAMRGSGDVKVVMGLTWFSTYAIRLPLAYFVSGVDIPIPDFLGGGMITNPRLIEAWFGLTPGLTALWLALCSEMVLRGGLFSVRFFQGGWLKAKV